MNLQLPPERPLPQPDRMVEDILRSQPARAGSPVARRAWLALAAAAVLVGVAAGVLVSQRAVLGPGPVGVPSPVSTGTVPVTKTPTPGPPSAAPRSSTSPSRRSASVPDRSEARLRTLGETAVFANFEVTVTQVRSYVDRTAARAKVCVRALPPDPTGDTTRVSIDPWALVAGEGGRAARRPASPSVSDYPVEAYLRVGQCVEGWIEFAAPPRDAPVRSVRYENSLGDRADWAVA